MTTRRWRPLAAVAVLAVLGACAAPPLSPAITVMTWNVQTVEHEPRDWAPVIAAERPDVVGLQEVCVREAVELAAILRRDHGLDYTVTPGPIRPPGPVEAHAPVNAALGPVCGTSPDAVEFGLAVLSRLPSTSSEVVTYPPDHRDEQRGYLVVTMGTGTTIVDTHLGLNGVAGDQIRRLADAVPAGPVVILGDLNVPSTAPELAPLRRAFAEVDPDGRFPTTAEGQIDHIFVRGRTVRGEPRTPAVTASDHRPLIAGLG